MLRSLSGFKSRYHDLTLVVASEFDEWKVIVYGPNVSIHGARQFGELKAKDHAVDLAQTYYRERKQAETPALPAVEWTSTGPDDWLIFRG